MLTQDHATKRKRDAKRSRPQLVCVLADNSGSMSGEKAQAATEGIREMVLRCQTTGPRGPGRDYFRLVFIRFGGDAELVCNMTPVRQIDTETIEVVGDGGGTNITDALQLAYDGLANYMREVIEPHPERDAHPVPLVLLFSDGYNGYGKPEPVAKKIKDLSIDGDKVVVACAGIATETTDQPDEQLLRSIASPDCYFHVTEAAMLSAFLAEVGSSVASTPQEVAAVIRMLPDMRGIED